MNVHERVEVENKKNKDFLSLPCNSVNYQCLSKKKYRQKKNNNKEERKKKNTDRTQTKLNAPHIKYNVKILPQKLIIRDKQISEENFETKMLGVVSRFSTEKSFKT